jgi:hypothetical protein
MSECARRHTGLDTYLCPRCYLVSCGVIARDWDGWSWCKLVGHGRVLLYRLTRREPPVWVGPRQPWAGAIPWFDRAGVGLRFDEEGDDAWA